MKFRLVFIGKKMLGGNTKSRYQLCTDAGTHSVAWVVVAEGTTDFLREMVEALKCFTPEQKKEISTLLEKQDMADTGKEVASEI